PVAISLLFLFIISAAAPTAFYTLSLHDALPILRVLPVPVAPAIKPCLFIIFNARFTFAAAMTCPSSKPAPKNMYAPFGLYDALTFSVNRCVAFSITAVKLHTFYGNLQTHLHKIITLAAIWAKRNMHHFKPAALGFIFITVIIDVIGLGIIIPVMPALIRELTGGDLSEASQYGGWLMFVYASTQFLFAPVLGNLSDRYGRRPVLLFSLFGFSINYLLMGFAPSILWLFAGRLLAGITGASHTVAAAYIADVSEPSKRAQNFG